MKSIKIFGETFELCGSHAKPTNYFINNYANLEECYKSPSNIKKEIFEYWYKWFIQSDNICKSDFGICSYNSTIFCLNGYIWQGNECYYFYITPKHKRAWWITE